MKNRNVRNPRVALGLSILLLLVALNLVGCGYSKQQLDEARRQAYSEGASNERERWEVIVRKLEIENQALKNENKNLNVQLEQTAAELETQRLKARSYQTLFLTLLGFVGLSSLGLFLYAGYHFILKPHKTARSSESYNWTSPPPSVTQEG